MKSVECNDLKSLAISIKYLLTCAQISGKSVGTQQFSLTSTPLFTTHMNPMKPLGNPLIVRRLILALGLAIVCMTSSVMAQNADDSAALTQYNKLNPPPHGKPAVTYPTAAASVLQSIINIEATTGTFFVTGTSGPTVVFPATGTRLVANTADILSVIAAPVKSALTDASASLDLVTDMYVDLATIAVSSTDSSWAGVAAAAANNTALTTGGQALSQANADKAEIATLETALGHTATYDQIAAAVLLVSDTSTPLAEATLIEKAYVKVPPPAFTPLGAAIQSTDSGILGNGGAFLANLFGLDKGATDQESFIAGYTAYESATASALEVTASNIVAADPTLKLLSLASRTQIAQGLITSGTTASGGTNVNAIEGDVTTGIVSGYISADFGTATSPALAADTDQAKLVSSIISALGLSSAYTITGAGAVDLNSPLADVAVFVTTVEKNALVKVDTGASQTAIAQGNADDYVVASATDTSDIALKIAVTEGAISAWKIYAPQIVTAVSEQILSDTNYSTATLDTILTSFIGGSGGLETTNSGNEGWKPNNAMQATILLAIEQAISTSGTSAYSTLGDVAGAASGAVINTGAKAKSINAVVNSTLAYFYAISSTTTGPTASAAIGTIKAVANRVSESGTDAGTVTTTDQVAAALITGALTTGTLVQEIAQATATDLNIINAPAFAGPDKYIAALGGDLDGSAFDTTQMATGLADYVATTTGTFTPVQVAGDLAAGAGTKQGVNIGQTLAVLYPTQSAAIAAAVTAAVPASAGLDFNDSARLKVLLGVLSALQTSSSTGAAYSPTVSGSVAATDSVIADKAALAKAVAAAYPTTAPQMAADVAATNTTSDSSYVSDDLVIAENAAKGTGVNVVTTATDVEEVALGYAADPVATASAFATGFGSTPAAVVGLAYTAALSSGTAVGATVQGAPGNSVAESGSVGVTVALLSKVISVPSLTGSVALAVAEGATKTLLPFDPQDNNTRWTNYSYYTVAQIFGTQAANAKMVADYSAIAGDLAGNFANQTILGQYETTGTTGATNQAAAAIAYNLVSAILDVPANDTYSSKTVGYIGSIAEAVAAADPQAAADIFGYVAEAVNLAEGGQSSWTAKGNLNAAILTIQGDINTGVSGSADLNGVPSAAITAVVSGLYTSGSSNQLATDGFPLGDSTVAQADETPQVNY